MSTEDNVMLSLAIFSGTRIYDRGFMLANKNWTLRTLCKKFQDSGKEGLDYDKYDEDPTVFVGTDENWNYFNLSKMSDYPIDCTINSLLNFNAGHKYIAFKFNAKRAIVSDIQGGAKRRKSNVFEMMMIKASQQNLLPEKIYNPKNGKHKLKNFVIDYIATYPSVKFSANEYDNQNF